MFGAVRAGVPWLGIGVKAVAAKWGLGIGSALAGLGDQ